MATNYNPSVLNWATGKSGQKVGKGECWDLANSALKSAGAGSSADFGPMGEDDDYIWGDVVPDLKDVKPGDILQYRDFVQTTTTTIDVTFKDGSGSNDSTEVSFDHAHHTSIIKTNPGNGALTVLEQNHLGKKNPVKTTAIRWKDAATKTTVSMKMMKRGDTGKSELATVEVTVDVTVTGTLTAFRPKAK